MKSFYRLLNHHFSTMFGATMLLCTGVVLSPFLFIHAAMKNYSLYSVHERFETIYADSGCITVFYICTLALCAFFLKTIYADYWGSKSIYTYLTLPIRREADYFSRLLSLFISLTLLVAFQLLSVLLAYGLFSAKAGSINGGQFLMHNSLFLAFIRSEFLRVILPLGVKGLLSSLSILIAVITGMYYAALIERSKRYWGFLVVIAAVVVVMKVLNVRMSADIYDDSRMNWVLNSALLFIFSGFFIWHSIRLIKKGAIA